MSSIWVRGALVALCVAAAGPGEAQLAQEPVAVHIMAMREALRAGDAARADAEGEAAWCLSEMQSGGSPDTAAIAYTLARMRVQAGAAQAALLPAERAYELAPTSNNRVHVTNAAFVLGAAQMASGDRAGLQTLRAALAQPAPGADGAMAYDAASLWAGDALAHARWEEVEPAADAALLYAANARQGEALARGEALTWKGIGLVYTRRAAEAAATLRQAIDILTPISPEASPRQLEITPQERALATAMAWRAAVRNTTRDERDDSSPVVQPSPAGLEALCEWNVSMSGSAQHRRFYPRSEVASGAEGAAVVRIQVDEAGQLLDAIAVAGAPAGRFEEAAVEIARHWRFTRRDDTIENCRMETAGLLRVVSFRVEP